jgi:hypothetical protein
MMQLKFGFAALIAVGLMVGCSNPEKQATISPEGSARQADSSVSNPPTPNPPSTPGKTSPTPNQPNTAVSKPPNNDLPPQPTKTSSGMVAAAGTPETQIKADGQWHASKVSAAQIAKSTDDRLRSLKGVKASVQYILSSPVGDAKGDLVEKIQSPSVFALQYPVMVIDRKHGEIPVIAVATADGKAISESKNSQTSVRPVGSKAVQPQDLVEKWPLVASREVFSGIVDGRTPFSDYVAGLLDPKNGYTTTVRERKSPYMGHIVHDYMIVATRLGPASVTKGTSAVTLTIDANLYLPVTLTANINRPGVSRPDSMAWNAQWKSNSKFDVKEFRVTPPSKSSR